ncbi:MAG: methyl-accepting chemotaxis protein [Salinirussus sp.]
MSERRGAETSSGSVLDRIRGSYTVKFVGSFVVILLVVGAIGAGIAVTSSQALSEDAGQELRTTAESKARTLATWANNSQHVARLVSSSAPMRSGDLGRIGAYADRLIEEGGLTAGARAVHYVDASNTSILASTLESRVGGNPRAEGAPWAQQDLTTVADDEVIVTAFNPSVANVTVITFVTPVRGVEDRAIVYVTTLGGVADTLEAASETGFTVVVNGQGNTVFNSRNRTAVGTQHVPGEGVESPAVEAGLDGEAGYTSVNENAMGYAPVQSLNWVLVSHEPKSAVFGLQRSITRNLGLLLLTVVVGFGAIGATIGRNTLRDVRDLAGKANRIEDGDLDVTVETDRRDEIGDLYRAFGNMRDSIRASLRERIEEAERAQQEAEQAREEAEQARAESEAFSEALERTAEEYEAVMEACADGDLTRRLDPDVDSDAMAAIAVAFNEMLDEFERAVVELQSFASAVASASEGMATSSDEIEATSADVAESIERIAAGAERQNEDLEAVSEEMTSLSATVEEIASSSSEVATRSQSAVEMGTRGRELSSEAIEKMRRIDEKTAESVDRIRALDERIEGIVDIVDLIDGIASETNTLALNASIEAARADGSGDGFAVVADEVKSLAEETSEATDDIEDRITSVRESTAEVVAEMEETHDLVDTGLGTVEEGLGILEEIVDAVEEANTGVQSINEATDEQAESSQQVVEMVEAVAEVSSETVDEAGSVSAAAEEQSASVSEIATSAADLSEQSRELQGLLDRFETRSDVTASRNAEVDPP